jgi:tetratricopeptide (TPR) repeat protein
MLNKKRGVVLLSIKEGLNRIYLLCMIILINNCSEKTVPYENRPYNEELAVFERAQHYIKEESYEKAYKLYTYFIEEYPHHPLTDDAAYRRCYLHVIVSDKNSYLNYAVAQKQFQKFIETYQNSRYIIACKNWIDVLKKLNNERLEQNQTPANNKVGTISARERISDLEKENEKLKETLLELQKAIER